MVSGGTILGTPTPESIPTPSPTTPQPVTAPTGDLQTVGVIPRARGLGSETDLEPYLAKVLSVSLLLSLCHCDLYVVDVAITI